jgi:hypothetical protein
LAAPFIQSGRDLPVCRAASGDCYQGMGPRLLIERLGRYVDTVSRRIGPRPAQGPHSNTSSPALMQHMPAIAAAYPFLSRMIAQ